MEQFFKIIHFFIHFFYKDENKESFKNIIGYCKEIDNLINKRYNFCECHKDYDSKVKYLIKNFTYPLINKFSKSIKSEKYNSLTDSKKIKLEYIFSLIIFGPHCIVMNHTMPVYSPTGYHNNIYHLCKKIDEIIDKSKNKEIYYFFLNKLFNYLKDIQDNIFNKVEATRIKILYSKNKSINLQNKLVMKKQLEQELKNKKYKFKKK